MISKKELERVAKSTNLNLYQQEKDYLIKLFLYNYYSRFENAVFKGGTCIKYLYGLDRFSEDLDFNLLVSPSKFENEVKKTLAIIKSLGIENYLIKGELFKQAFTCEIAFNGPLYSETKQTRNKFRIDAGKRTGTIKKPKWQLIKSEYPETPPNFLVLTMDENEILAEKILSLMERNKGRDLYDTWFLLKNGIKIDQKLLEKKGCKEIKIEKFPSKRIYERDIKRLTRKAVPYEQIIHDVKNAILSADGVNDNAS